MTLQELEAWLKLEEAQQKESLAKNARRQNFVESLKAGCVTWDCASEFEVLTARTLIAILGLEYEETGLTVSLKDKDGLRKIS
jgi:hypothetical protein